MQSIFAGHRLRATALAAVVLLSACGGSSSTGTTGGNNNPGGGGGGNVVATTSGSMVGTAVVPPAISVGSGAVVTFTNNDGFAHNVTFTNTAIGATPDFSTGSRTLTMPTTAGTYAYRCTIHAGMSGTVTVQ